jgi:hypothetical protein
VIAVECGLKRPAVAHGESSDTGACFDDDARGLMPEQHGIDIEHAADRALGVGMHIGPAHTHRLNADLDFAGAGIVNWHVNKPECQGSNEFGSAHRIFFLRNDTLSVGWNKRRAGSRTIGARQEGNLIRLPNGLI